MTGPEIKHLVCQNCGKEADIVLSLWPIITEQDNGWHKLVDTEDGETIWWCDDCYKSVVWMAAEHKETK